MSDVGWVTIGGGLLAIALLGQACTEQVSNAQSDARTGPSEETTAQEGGWRIAPDSVCEPMKDAIERWVDTYRTCERDADCAITEIRAGCVPAFLCAMSLRVGIDRSAFDRLAEEKKEGFVPSCGCVIANCQDTSELEAFCDAETKLCAARLRLSEPDGSSCSREETNCR